MAVMPDALSFARHARLEVLLVPVSPLSRASFTQHVERICAHARIPLRDIPPDNRGSRAALSASPHSQGHVLLSFVTSHSRSTSYLEDFEPARRLFGIIGIADCAEWADLADAHAEFQQVLRRNPRVYATRCYAFGAHKQDVDVEGVVAVPSAGDIDFYLATLLADFASSILYELSNMVR